MEYLIVAVVALIASGLTLFSGFGLGSLLLPAFALFFPAEIAVALTAVVHLLNNIFKLFLVGKFTDRSVLLKFGLPAIIAAYFGARALLWLAGLMPLAEFNLFSFPVIIMPVNLAVGLLMILFALVELLPSMKNFSLDQNYLPLGGTLSGFFGGLSGHQGALRTIFLLRCGLTKETFIGTGVSIACLIDVARLAVYSERFAGGALNENSGMLITATLAAFVGAYIGKKIMDKVTMRGIQILVSVMLIILALGMILGII